MDSLATRIGERPMARKMTRSAIEVQRERRAGFQQMDLFAIRRVVGTPDWPDLPKDARETLVDLMTRLILDHVQAAGPTTTGARDER